MQVDVDEVAFITETRLLVTGEERSTRVPHAVLDGLRLEAGCSLRWIGLYDGSVVVTRAPTRPDQDYERQSSQTGR